MKPSTISSAGRHAMKNEIMIAVAIVALAFMAACSAPLPADGDAICDQTRASRSDLANALIETDDIGVRVKGTRLIQQIDGACMDAGNKNQ